MWNIARYISMLEDRYIEIFTEYLNGYSISTPLSMAENNTCGSCIYFKTCEINPKRSDSPRSHECDLWDLHLYAKRSSKHCPDGLKLLLEEIRQITKKEKVYVRYFLGMQLTINKIKKEKGLGVVNLGDELVYQMTGSSVDCVIVGFTLEHIVLETSDGARLMALYESIKSMRCVEDSNAL